ncbi:TPA: GNAT family N-acetyltransferase [Stenotrophomonas maltophilia]
MMNIDLVWVDASPSREYSAQVREIVRESAPDLSMFAYDKLSPLYEYLVEREIVRASYLLGRVGVPGASRMHLLLAISPVDDVVAGFALVTPCLDTVGEASVTMVAVRDDWRDCGVFSALMQALKARFKNRLGLTCKPKLVEMYEKDLLYWVPTKPILSWSSRGGMGITAERSLLLTTL